MHHHNGADAGGQREHQSERCKDQRLIGNPPRWRRRGRHRSCGRIDFTLRRAADHRHLQRQHDNEVQACIDKTGFAPADLLDHESAKRPADGAGETAEQRQIGDRLTRLFAVDAGRVRRRPRHKARSPCRARAPPRPPGKPAAPAPDRCRLARRRRTASSRTERAVRRGGRPSGPLAARSSRRPAARSRCRRPPSRATSQSRRTIGPAKTAGK